MADKNKSLEQIDEEIKALKKKKRELQQAQRKAEKERLEKAQKELGKKVIETLDLTEEEIPHFEKYLKDHKPSIRVSLRDRTNQNMLQKSTKNGTK